MRRERIYKIEISASSKRELVKLERRISHLDYQGLVEAIENLAVDARPFSVKQLKIRENTFRIRISNFRIIYQVRNKESLVLVIKVARRIEDTYD